ncbi:MAG TPA: HAMP domain-containing sensor histidine kinase [Pyrinomonadaceae bacterium]|nr:HAMP domain-containing sensor histidine kinase [Pyrinomonadaceae bacterium]
MKTDQGNSCGEWSPVEFLALISHELRSPIQAILGWAEIVESGPIDHETSAHAIQVIKRNAKRQVEMISQLTHFSRLNLGGLRLGAQPAALVPTIEAAIETMTPQARTKNVILRAEIEQFEDAVIGDPVWLQQVFTNLLSNAIKFTSSGGRVELRCTKKENDAEVTVTDTGHGISEEFLPCVFDRFRRGPIKTNGDDGLGLGLAIARYIVEAHGGSIGAHSNGLGCGSTFTVHLPFVLVCPPSSNEGRWGQDGGGTC